MPTLVEDIPVGEKLIPDDAFDEERDAKMRNAQIYSAVLGQSPETLYDMTDALNTEIYGSPDDKGALQKSHKLILDSKSWTDAVSHGIEQAGIGMVKSLRESGFAVADVDKEFWEWVGVRQPEILQRWDEEAFDLKREWDEWLRLYYKENPDKLAEAAPETGYLQKALWYTENPKVVVQHAIQSAPIMLLGGLGKVAGLGKAGMIALFGGPTAAETYTEARTEGTDVVPALGQAMFTGGGEGAIEEWTFGRKIGLAKNFSKIVKSGFPKVAWEALKAYGRGTAEEAGQQANRNFWRFIFTDANQKISEGVADAAAAGGPVELLMSGVFGMGGYTLNKGAEFVDQAEQHRRLNIIEGEIQKSQNFTEAQKAEISQEIDSVREDVDSGVYLPEEEAEPPAQPVEKAPSVPVAGQTAETGAIEPGAEAERQLKEGPRRKILQAVNKEILDNPVYQVYAEGLKDMRRELPPGPYFVEPRFKAEIEDITGKPGQQGFNSRLYNQFTFEKEPGKGWLTWDEVADDVGITDISTFAERVALNIGDQEGQVDMEALAQAMNAADNEGEAAYLELLAMKREALQEGLTPDTINETIEAWAAKHPELPSEMVEGQKIQVQESDYVERKPGVSKPVGAEARKAQASLAEQQAITKAREKARRDKTTYYVQESEPGKHSITKTAPKEGRYLEVSAPAEGQITQPVTERMGEPVTVKRFVSKDAYEAAKKRLLDRGTLRTGIGPRDFADFATVGAYHIENGLRTLSEWSQQMIDEFGEKIQPHLDRIWKDAQVLSKPPKKPVLQKEQGTGERKTTTLSTRAIAKAIEENLVSEEELAQLPQYRTMNMIEQAGKVQELIEGDYDRAKRIAMGTEKAPEGLYPENVYTGVLLKAVMDADVITQRDLAVFSFLTKEASILGQRIKSLDAGLKIDPVKAMQEIAVARERAVAKRRKIKSIPGQKRQMASEAKAEIKKTTHHRQSWNEFVQLIRC